MNQPEASALYKKMLEAGTPIDDAALIKVATDRGMSTAQLEMMAQIHNSATTMAHLRTSGNSDVRGDNFKTIDVPALSSKYAAMDVPLKDHPEKVSKEKAQGRRVNIVESDNSGGWFTTRVASENRQEVAIGAHFDTEVPVKKLACCPECNGEDIKVATEGVCCITCGHGYPDSVTTPIKCARELRVIDQYRARYADAKIAAELVEGKATQAVNAALKTLRGVITKSARVIEIHQDVVMAGGDALDLAIVKQAAGVEYDVTTAPKKFIAEDRHSCVALIKKIAAAMRESEQATTFIEHLDAVLPKLRDMKFKVASHDKEALDTWLGWKSAAVTASGGYSAKASTPAPAEPIGPDTSYGAAADAANAAGTAASTDTMPMSDDEMAQENEKLRAEIARLRQQGGGEVAQEGEAPPSYKADLALLPMEQPEPEKRQDNFRPTIGGTPVKKTLRELLAQARADVGGFAPDRTADNMRIRNGVRDAHAGATLMKFMHLDDVISAADPNRVTQLNDDLLAASPDITRQPERWRAALREMISYDSPTVDGLTAQAKLTSGIQANEEKPKSAKPTQEVEKK